jgi:hypothetical protein
MTTERKLILTVVAWTIAILILFVSGARCEDTVPIELSLTDWQKVVVGLEEHRICQEELNYIKQDNVDLEKQNKLLKENLALSNEIIKKGEQRVSNLEKELTLQDKACKEALKQSKPSIFQEIGKAVIFILIGGGIVLLL